MSLGFGAGASRRQDCSRTRCSASSCAWCSCSFLARAWRGPGAGGRGGNDPDQVSRDLVAVPRLEYPGQVYLDLQPRELASANGRKPECCSPVFVRVRLEDVGAPIEYPFEPLGCPHTTSSCLATVVCCCFATAQHNSWCCCCAGTSVSQDEPFATTGYVCHFARLGAQSVFDLDASLLCIAYIRPPAGKGVPSLRLDMAALPHVVSVLPLVEPKHVAASLRHSPSRGYVGDASRVPGREHRDCAALCNFERLLEVEGRGVYADRMALVGPPNPRNQGRGWQEDSRARTVWMQLCRSFASRQDCAYISVLGIASERSQLYALLVGSQNVDPEDGACPEPEVSRGLLYGPLPGLLLVCVCLGGPDPNTQEPACCRVRIPGD